MIEVIIACESPAWRTGLAALIQADPVFMISGSYSTPKDLLARLPVEDGILVVDEAHLIALGEEKFDLRSTSILLIEETDLSARILNSLVLKSCGILPLEATGEALRASLAAMHEGWVIRAPSANRPLGDPLVERGARPSEESAEPLTRREKEILNWMGQGMANKQISRMLGISENTVKYHISSILSKFGASNRAEAVRIGVRLGIVAI